MLHYLLNFEYLIGFVSVDYVMFVWVYDFVSMAVCYCINDAKMPQGTNINYLFKKMKMMM